MTIIETAAILLFLVHRILWLQREPDLSRARSRCSSR
jgi:hypothetical protein